MDKEQESMRSFVFEVIKMFLLALIIIVPIRIFLFQPFIVRGASMEPNFYEREYLIINEFGYKDVQLFGDAIHIEPRKEFERLDIAVFRAPVGKGDFYIKRVIGLPGERIVVEDGKVTIFNVEAPQGMELDESHYLPVGRTTNGTQELTLAEDEYYVLGDNRGASSDSRVFGPVNKDLVVGRVLVRAFPLDKMDIF